MLNRMNRISIKSINQSINQSINHSGVRFTRNTGQWISIEAWTRSNQILRNFHQYHDDYKTRLVFRITASPTTYKPNCFPCNVNDYSTFPLLKCEQVGRQSIGISIKLINCGSFSCSSASRFRAGFPIGSLPGFHGTKSEMYQEREFPQFSHHAKHVAARHFARIVRSSEQNSPLMCHVDGRQVWLIDGLIDRLVNWLIGTVCDPDVGTEWRSNRHVTKDLRDFRVGNDDLL